ncbi:hypothetical protein [Falsiroseomonas oryzae]|uniref:hypothetical protein n=1 Tax=Falsiroseomonas oryzae TaxID=2766473 RepID=UPI0022EAD953|nr:hypothetical protein [Roseomonas sp. MO-31]
MSQPANDMRNLQDDASRLGRDAAASGQRLAEDARAELARLRAQVERLMEDRVTPALGSAADTVEDYTRRARATIEENAYALSDTVRQRPLLTVALVAVGGYLLGRLMGGHTYVHSNEKRHH